jgi:hypothetical protein
MLKNYCLLVAMLVFLPLVSYGKERPKGFKCEAYYDIYDDTCYFKSGAFIFFGYKNGNRQVTKNGKTVRYFFWFNGTPYRSNYWPFWY